jgi:hypothetical protein
MTSSGMDKKKTKKQSDQDTLPEVTLEMAKPRVAMSARECDTDENRDSNCVTDDPMELGSTGVSLTPNANTRPKTPGLKARLPFKTRARVV